MIETTIKMYRIRDSATGRLASTSGTPGVSEWTDPMSAKAALAILAESGLYSGDDLVVTETWVEYDRPVPREEEAERDPLVRYRIYNSDEDRYHSTGNEERGTYRTTWATLRGARMTCSAADKSAVRPYLDIHRFVVEANENPVDIDEVVNEMIGDMIEGGQ